MLRFLSSISLLFCDRKSKELCGSFCVVTDKIEKSTWHCDTFISWGCMLAAFKLVKSNIVDRFYFSLQSSLFSNNCIIWSMSPTSNGIEIIFLQLQTFRLRCGKGTMQTFLILPKKKNTFQSREKTESVYEKSPKNCFLFFLLFWASFKSNFEFLLIKSNECWCLHICVGGRVWLLLSSNKYELLAYLHKLNVYDVCTGQWMVWKYET